MVDIIVYSVITIHLPPLPYLRIVDSGHWKRNLSTYRNASGFGQGGKGEGYAEQLKQFF